MFLALNKKLLWTIVIWFAILQMLSPLIHAHLEINAPGQGHGIHLHADEMASIAASQSAASQGADKTPAFQEVTASLHTIGIDQALLKKVELLPASAPMLSLLFVIYSLVLIILLSKIKSKLKPKFRFLFPPLFYLRHQFRPRAPPFF